VPTRGARFFIGRELGTRHGVHRPRRGLLAVAVANRRAAPVRDATVGEFAAARREADGSVIALRACRARLVGPAERPTRVNCTDLVGGARGRTAFRDVDTIAPLARNERASIRDAREKRGRRRAARRLNEARGGGTPCSGSRVIRRFLLRCTHVDGRRRGGTTDAHHRRVDAYAVRVGAAGLVVGGRIECAQHSRTRAGIREHLGAGVVGGSVSGFVGHGRGALRAARGEHGGDREKSEASAEEHVPTAKHRPCRRETSGILSSVPDLPRQPWAIECHPSAGERRVALILRDVHPATGSRPRATCVVS
jgi:hypothetical protein